MSENYNSNNNYNDHYYDNDDNTDISYNNTESYDDIYSNSSGRHKVKKKRSVFKKILLTILIIILILVLFIGTYAVMIILRINYTDDSPNTDSVEEIVGELKYDSNIENIMIFGVDNHAENENGRSDSMILLSIDKSTQTLKITSFLRDLYLTVPGYGEDRLNAAYSYGGATLAIETIEYNFEIKIDKYVLVDFESFTSIIDAMGGIDLELTSDEIDYINWQCWKNHQVETRNELNISDYTFYTDDDGYDVAKVHLNGRQALWYARDRDSAGSDFDRTYRQRTVINTVISNLKSSDPITVMKVIYDVSPMITTNLSKGELIGLGTNIFAYLKYDIDEFRVPTNSNFSNTWVGESQVLTIDDIDYEKQLLFEFIFNED